MSRSRKDRPQSTRAPRIPTFEFVTICNTDGSDLSEATVREISDRGAHLRLKSSVSLPDRLVIRSEPDRSCRTATLKWRSGASIGVEFDDERATERSPVDRERRIRIICSHLAGSS